MQSKPLNGAIESECSCALILDRLAFRQPPGVDHGFFRFNGGGPSSPVEGGGSGGGVFAEGVVREGVRLRILSSLILASCGF